MKGSHDPQNDYEEENSVPWPLDTDGASLSEQGSGTTSDAADVECYPLESILIAMTVQKQRDFTPVVNTT